MPERLDRQKLDNTVPSTTVPDDDPSAPNDSPEKRTNELLAAMSRAIFDRIGPVVARPWPCILGFAYHCTDNMCENYTRQKHFRT